MKYKSYAPVIIPTLNRCEHFKRCLESLETCTGAEYTDVYVALDFPPSEKYIDGWKKNDEYLSFKQGNNKFRNLIVIRRERNYGVCHKDSNMSVLLRDIQNKYDYYILSEDDNEFSPSFLEYMNACFNRFADDSRIAGICGYNFPNPISDNYKNNFYVTKRFCAWGNGSWTKKRKMIEKYYDLQYLRNIIRDKESYKKLRLNFPRGISLIYSMLKRGKLHGDAIYEIYANLEDKYFIMPTVSKVRNYGNDGTGVHSLKVNVEQNLIYVNQSIDQSKEFEFTDDIFTVNPFNINEDTGVYTVNLRNMYKQLVMNFDVWLLRHFNFIPKSKYI